MDNLKDLLQKKADNLDLKRGDDLQIIQIELDRLFGDNIAKASSITERSQLIITTDNPQNMTTIRYAHVKILSAIRNQTERKIDRFIVRLSR